MRPARSVAGVFDLLGGRYCSIQGGLAAQIKVRDTTDGRIHTLYATQMTPALEKIGAREDVRDEVRITLWSEGDVFFGLATFDANP